MEQGGTWTFAITRRGRRHIEIWIGTSVVPGQSLWCKKESIGRGSPQVSLGNITADTATNCGVTHIGSELPELQGVEKSNQQLKGVKPGVERTDV